MALHRSELLSEDISLGSRGGVKGQKRSVVGRGGEGEEEEQEEEQEEKEKEKEGKKRRGGK